MLQHLAGRHEVAGTLVDMSSGTGSAGRQMNAATRSHRGHALID